MTDKSSGRNTVKQVVGVRRALKENWQLLAVAALVSVVVCYFNYDARAMAGIHKYYQCFRDVIAAGFDLSVNTCDTNTFPMWGYGWLLLLTDSKPVLLALQCFFSIFSVLFFLITVRSAVGLTETQFRVLKWSLALSLPWYAVNAVLWPYAVANCFLWISLALLIRAHRVATPELWPWLLSGLCFGIMLNFRSDYILLPVGLMLVVLLFGRRTFLAKVRNILAWCAPMLLAMSLWGAYTTQATGHYLHTSTNGGHVLYTSLGQLPGNSWGILPRDEDPGMAALLEKELGKPASSLSYEADVVLKARFRELVFASPGEYARKVVHNAGSLLFGGAYAGEFHEEKACQPDCLEKYVEGSERMTSQTQVARGLLTGRLSLNPDLALADYLRLTLLSVSVSQTLLVVFFGLLFSIFLLPYCLLKRNAPMLLILAVVGYQAALSSLTFYMRVYSSNVYVLLLVVIVFTASLPWRGMLSIGSTQNVHNRGRSSSMNDGQASESVSL